MKENLPLREMCPYERLADHPNWKTVLRKLKAHGVPHFDIM